MAIASAEILETLGMIHAQNLDIRTVTLGIDLSDCAGSNVHHTARKAYDKVCRRAGLLVRTAEEAERDYGIPIVNKRVSVTPVSWFAAACEDTDYTPIARELDRAACELGIDFLGGYSALVEKDLSSAARNLIRGIPEALHTTSRLCSSVNIGTSRAGINMEAVALMGQTIVRAAALSAATGGSDCCRLVVFCNAVHDNPFMAGAFFGVGEGDCSLSVGISGPGTVRAALVQLGPNKDLQTVAEEIKRTAFKITRAGELIGRRVAARLGVPFNIVDLSLAPTPAPGDSVGDILEAIGVEKVGGPGTTAALALLNDAVKRGGAMATSHAGGMSGAFIPVSEDATLSRRAAEGALCIEKLEAMTAVCSVGLDMIVVPGDTPAETLSGIIADEAAIGMCNNKTTAVRIIPAPGRKVGEWVEFGGLLGGGPVMPVNTSSCAVLIRRGGRIPGPLKGLTN
jgi:uncharacterized protein (UPF0210 family)